MMAATLAGIAAISLLAACSSSGSPSQGGGGAASTGSSKEIIIFNGIPKSSPYVAQWEIGANAAAQKYGWTLKYFDTTGQTQQNTVIAQFLASGQPMPMAFAWWPSDEQVGHKALLELAATHVPIFAANVPPTSLSLPYVKLYAGTSFTDNGASSGNALVQARKAFVAAGHKLHGNGKGNVLLVAFPQDASITSQKTAGILPVIRSAGFNLLDITYVPQPAAAAQGFAAMSALIPKYRAQGIDFVYAYNDAIAAGVIQALEQAGLTPGKDVYVLGGNCEGDSSNLVSGAQFSTEVVGGKLEGAFWVNVVHQWFQSKRVTPGTFRPATTATAAPVLTGAPHKMNYLPQPTLILGKGSAAANQAALSAFGLWGQKYSQICDY